MNHGIVHRLEAIVEVKLLLPNREKLSIDFTIHIGFAGALTLPSNVIEKFALPFFQEIDATLANGNRVRTKVYSSTILTDGKEITVAIISMGDRPLLGTALLEGNRLCAEFIEGRKVNIESL